MAKKYEELTFHDDFIHDIEMQIARRPAITFNGGRNI